MMLCELRKRLLHVLAHARRQRKRTKRFDRAAWYDGKIAALEYALSQIEDFGSDKLGLLPEERTAYVPPAFLRGRGPQRSVHPRHVRRLAAEPSPVPALGDDGRERERQDHEGANARPGEVRRDEFARDELHPVRGTVPRAGR